MQERSVAQSLASRTSFGPDLRTPSLICFSHLRWDFVWQRPQHLMTRAAKGYRVLFIEEPIFRPDIPAHMEVSKRPQGVTVAVPMLPAGLDQHEVVRKQRDLVEELIGREANEPRVFWYYTPMAFAFARDLECDLCVYDNMDELSLFRGASQELLTLEDELFTHVDLVFTGGLSLYEAKRKRHRSVHAFPSSIDFDHFAKARVLKRDPEDQREIPHPRLGFFGVIDERMDLDFVRQAAELRPDWHFVMIGPVVKIDPAALPASDNLHWLGQKAYHALPDYLSGWDVGFMPFALNEATRFISPTKTPEFLAAGVPVVSTAIADVVRPYGEKGLVEIAKTPLEMIRKVEALMQRPKDAWLAKVDRRLAADSWDRTWGAMHRLMGDVMDATAARHPAVAFPTGVVAPAE